MLKLIYMCVYIYTLEAIQSLLHDMHTGIINVCNCSIISKMYILIGLLLSFMVNTMV